MLRYTARRLLATIPVLVVVTVFVFLLLHMTPGDPAAVIAGKYATSEDIARIHTELGLDRPLYEQFGSWVWRLAHGDLGESIFSGLPVTTLIARHAGPTLALAAGGIIFALLIAVPLGLLAAWKAGSWVDYLVMTLSVLGFSVPVFLTAYVLIYVLSVQLHWFPVQGYTSPAEGVIPFLRSIALPSVTLGFLYAALIARITRASLVNVLGEDYIRTAYAKGLSVPNVIGRHALKNAAVPIVTVVGVGFALLIGGTVVTETVFNIPGLGRLVADSVLAHDYPVIQGLILIFSAAYVLVNLLVDLSYALLDPRIQYH